MRGGKRILKEFFRVSNEQIDWELPQTRRILNELKNDKN